jgi:hypothetical protein
MLRDAGTSLFAKGRDFKGICGKAFGACRGVRREHILCLPSGQWNEAEGRTKVLPSYALHRKPVPGFLVVQIREYFQFRADWYRRSGAVCELVGQYYVVLRSVLRVEPRLRRCLCRCRQCRIFFLTHPRNAERRDLCCPFGCRQVRRRQDSTRRSTEYYRSREGKVKKREHNERRRLPRPSPSQRSEADRGSRRSPEEAGFDFDIVSYLGMLISLIEGRRVSEGEILSMLARAVRQHSMARRRRQDYVLSCWKGSLESP